MAQQPPVGHSLLIIEASQLHSLSHTTIGRTPLDEGSALRTDLYLTTQTLYNRQTPILPAGFEPTIPASARAQTYALYRAAIGVIHWFLIYLFIFSFIHSFPHSLTNSLTHVSTSDAVQSQQVTVQLNAVPSPSDFWRILLILIQHQEVSEILCWNCVTMCLYQLHVLKIHYTSFLIHIQTRRHSAFLNCRNLPCRINVSIV
jgi:hypothetical protein